MNEKRADGVREARSLFQERGSGAVPTSALQLWVYQIEFKQARQLNELWHSRLPRIGDPPSVMSAGLHYAATFEETVYAVAIWTHPVNRSLPQNEWLELRKYRPEIARLISYQDTEVHTGAIYAASGWERVGKPRRGGTDGGWTNRVRVRPPSQSTAKKQRWEKVLYE